MSDEKLPPEVLVELTVEHGARSWKSHSMQYEIRPENLEAMSMLDYCDLDGFSLYSGPDTYTALQHERAGARRENWIVAKLRDTIRGDDSYREKFIALLDAELRISGNWEQFKGCNAGIKVRNEPHRPPCANLLSV